MAVYVDGRRNSDLDSVMKATYHLGKPGDGGPWSTDERCTTHAVRNDGSGVTVCGVLVGTEAKGWLRSGGYVEAITCRRCLRSLRRAELV